MLVLVTQDKRKKFPHSCFTIKRHFHQIPSLVCYYLTKLNMNVPLITIYIISCITIDQKFPFLIGRKTNKPTNQPRLCSCTYCLLTTGLSQQRARLTQPLDVDAPFFLLCKCTKKGLWSQWATEACN